MRQETTAVKPKGLHFTDLPELLVADPDALASCVEALIHGRQFGLDTEFIGENSYHPQLCLVQVSTQDALYLIDPMTCGPLDAFWNAVATPELESVVHAGREEVRLCCLACGKPPGSLVDLQLAAGLTGLGYPLGHGTLVKTVLGISLPKGETLTEWGKRPLTKSQIHYAFDDVRYLLPIWQRLSTRIDKLGRREWAKEEFSRLNMNATPPPTGDNGSSQKWRKLRGAGGLDRRKLAIVREVFAWREAAAAKFNRPPRTVIRDDLILEIARRGPTTEHDLYVIRGLAKRDLGAILSAVQRGRELPLEQCPAAAEREQDPPQVGMVVGILMAVLGDVCARLEVAPNLVATTNDIKALVRSRLQGGELPSDTLLLQGWRQKHILPELMAVLEGRRSVRVMDVRAEAPLGYDEAGTK